jgi:hypothetical protein
MAGTNLTVFSSPVFPQLFDFEIRRVGEIVRANYEQAFLTTCCHEEPIGMWSDHTSEKCNRDAVVHDLESGQEFCSKHFTRLQLRRELEAL